MSSLRGVLIKGVDLYIHRMRTFEDHGQACTLIIDVNTLGVFFKQFCSAGSVILLLFSPCI